MSDDIKQAADRLRRVLSGQAFRDIYGRACFDDTRERMLNADKETLAEAYLAEHLADDNEAITEEWVKSMTGNHAPKYWSAGWEYSWPPTRLRYAPDQGFYFDKHELDRCLNWTPHFLREIQTRGQLRKLLAVLVTT